MADGNASTSLTELRAFGVSEVCFSERRVPATRAPASYWLLLTFILLLYLNVPIVLPAIELIHPAKLVGAAALFTLVVAVMSGGIRFQWGWPEGGILIGFLGVAALSCLTALWPGYAAAAVADLTKMVLVYFFLVNCAPSAPCVRGVVWTMVIGGMIPTIGVLRNFFNGKMLEDRTAWVGIFANPNDLAYSLVVLVPLAAFLIMRSSALGRLALASMVLCYVAAIFVTFSRGGLVGLVAVIGLFAWRQRSMMLKIAIVALVVAGIVLAARFWSRSEDFKNLRGDNSFQERLATSKAGLEMFLDHPLLGVGPACSVVAWPLYAPKGLYTRGALVTHNTLIQALSETGALGCAAFVLFLIFAFRRARRLAVHSSTPDLKQLGTALEIALWGFVICGLSAGNVLSWFVYILAGLISAVTRIEEESNGKLGD